jgi:hypothetical protein
MFRRVCGAWLVLLTMLVAVSGSSASSAVSEVSVARCPTTYGIDQSHPRLPARISVSASSRATAGLSAYSNGALVVLAPRGWSCHAIVGADGSASITITTGSTSDVRQPAVTAHFADTYGTAALLGCSLFASASHQLPAGVRCGVHKPRRERIAPANAHAVYFTDPPHVHGDGSPSGGSDPAHGLMVFVAASGGFDGYGFTATCALPAKETAICATVLGDALTRIPADE